MVVAELADLVGRDHTTVSRQLAKLESLKFVKRRDGAKDRRKTTTALTASGAEIAHKIASARRRLLAKALADWSEADRRALATLNRRFADALLPASGQEMRIGRTPAATEMKRAKQAGRGRPPLAAANGTSRLVFVFGVVVNVHLAGFRRVMMGVRAVARGRMGVVGSGLVIAFFIVLCGVTMVTGRFLMMRSGVMMMFARGVFVRHALLLFVSADKGVKPTTHRECETNVSKRGSVLFVIVPT